jgi:hypothetical protein
MAKRLLVAFSLAVALFTPAVHAETFGAVLTGPQEAPSPNDSPGYANATVTLDPSHTSIRVVMNITNLTTPINNAHIHGESPRGTASGVRLGFNINTDIVNGKMDKTYTIDKALGDLIASKPEQFYLNVHTTQFPAGEVRGQLTPLDTVQTFAAELRGSNEVPANPSTAVGSAYVTLDNNNVITWEVNTSVQSPTRGHIHENIAGVNGPIVVPFTETAAGFTNGRLRGTSQLTPELAGRIRANPAGFYVNVHTTAFGGGEVRGQMLPVNEYDIAVAGKVQGANGENFVTDVRVFNPSFAARAAVLVEFFASTNGGATNATTSFAVDIAPRGTAVLNDIAGATGLNITSGVGALRVTSIAPLAVSSVIYDDRRARNGGTIGQFVPALPRSAALRRGVLTQLANNTASRTNVGLFNPNATAVDFRFELRDPAGAIVGIGNFTVPPYAFQQSPITTYFPGVTINGPAFSLSYSASAPVHVYGSNVDNVSSDQIYLSAINDPGEP